MNQLTSPPEEKARPVAGDDQGAQRGAVGEPGRGGDQLADQLRAHRVQRLRAVEGQRADLAVDLDRSVSSSGGLGTVVVRHASLPVCDLAGGPGAYPFCVAEKPTTDRPPTSELRAEQRKQLPDQPGVYVFSDARGEVLYVGKATSIRKRVASHFAGPHRGGLRR